jgi:hypothetical protein
MGRDSEFRNAIRIEVSFSVDSCKQVVEAEELVEELLSVDLVAEYGVSHSEVEVVAPEVAEVQYEVFAAQYEASVPFRTVVAFRLEAVSEAFGAQHEVSRAEAEVVASAYEVQRAPVLLFAKIRSVLEDQQAVFPAQLFEEDRAVFAVLYPEQRQYLPRITKE